MDLRDEGAVRAAVDAATRLGLDAGGATVVRRGTTVLVRLPASGALARVHGPGADLGATQEVAVAGVLARAGVPAVPLVGEGAQPVATAAGVITVWAWAEATEDAASLVDLARTARALHERTAALIGTPVVDGVPALDPVGAALRVLGAAAGPGEDAGRGDGGDVARLRSVAARLGARWPALAADDPLGAALVHGDLHRDNVVVTAAGPLLIDLETAGVGPRSFDLAPIAVAARRFGAAPADVDAAFTAYGTDPRPWPGFAEICDVYELWITAWTVAHRMASPAAEEEARRRMARWRHGTSEAWTLR